MPNRPLSHGGHFESQENKKLCICTSSLVLDERLDVQNLLFQHCVIKVYTFRNFNGCLNKRWMYPAQTITIEWMTEKCLDKRQTTTKPPNTSYATEQTDGRKCRQTLAAQIAKSSFTSNGKSTPKTTSIRKRLNIQPTNLARSCIHSVCLSI